MARWIALLLLIICACSCRKPHGPLEVSFWYWHTPFKLSEKEVTDFRSIGVKRLFVRAGTFTHDPAGTKLDIPQQWRTGSGAFPIVLVYNWDGGLVSHFRSLNLENVARCMVRDIRTSADAAAAAGVNIQGIQFDIDAPTKLLNRYAALVRQVKLQLHRKDWTYSGTALSSWLGTRGIGELARQLDYLAPQFYESRVAHRLDDASTISDLKALEAGLQKADDLPIPYYAGLAAYGHAVLYDDVGHLAGIYRGLAPQDALRHPSLSFKNNLPQDSKGKEASRQTYVGEDLLSVKAVKPGAQGRGLGYTIAYSIPTPQLVESQMTVVDEGASDNCQGVIFYRVAGDLDTTAIATSTVRDVLAHNQPDVSLKVDVSSRPYAWTKLENASRSSSNDVNLEVRNLGSSPTQIKPGAVKVLLTLTSAGVEEALPGDFDSAVPGILNDGRFEPSSRSRANAILLQRCSILPSQVLHSGHMRVQGQVSHVSWSAVLPGGFETRLSPSP